MNHAHTRKSDWLSPLTIIALIIALIASGPADANARIIFGALQGGLTIPGSGNSLDDRFDNGPGGGGGLMFQFAEDVNMVVRLEYHRFPNADNSLLADRGALRAVIVTSLFRYMFRDEIEVWRPFVSLGFGTADMSLADDGDTFTEWDSDDLRGVFHIGAGVQIRTLDRFWIVLDARYMSVASPGGGEATSFYPLSLSVEF